MLFSAVDAKAKVMKCHVILNMQVEKVNQLFWYHVYDINYIHPFLYTLETANHPESFKINGYQQDQANH